MGRLGAARERLIAPIRSKIRERAINNAEVQITLLRRKVEDYSEEELEIIVADEERKIYEKLKVAPLALIILTLTGGHAI